MQFNALLKEQSYARSCVIIPFRSLLNSGYLRSLMSLMSLKIYYIYFLSKFYICFVGKMRSSEVHAFYLFIYITGNRCSRASELRAICSKLK